MNNKKNKWLLAMKELAEEKSVSTEVPLEKPPATHKFDSWHKLTWMMLGVAAAMFMSAYWDLNKENKILKAMLAINVQPTAQLKQTGFDFTQPMQDVDWNGYRVELPPLPPTIDDNNIKI